MAQDVFTCYRCGRTFQKGQSDEDAVAEWRRLTEQLNAPPEVRNADDLVTLCDACYAEFLRWLEIVRAEQHQA